MRPGTRKNKEGTLRVETGRARYRTKKTKNPEVPVESICIMYIEKESLIKTRKKWSEIADGKDVKMKND